LNLAAGYIAALARVSRCARNARIMPRVEISGSWVRLAERLDKSRIAPATVIEYRGQLSHCTLCGKVIRLAICHS